MTAREAIERLRRIGGSPYIHGEDDGEAAAYEAIKAAIAVLEAQERALADMTRERDAYKRAKAENDERFMTERDEARNERDKARAIARWAHACIDPRELADKEDRETYREHAATMATWPKETP